MKKFNILVACEESQTCADITTKRRRSAKDRSKSFYGIAKALCTSFIQQMEFDYLEYFYDDRVL